MTFAKILEADDKLSRKLRVAEQPGPLRTLSAVFAHSGDSWFWLIGLVVLWWLGTDFWKARALVMFVAIWITATIVLTLKFTIRRQRPSGEWGDIYRKTDPHPFPSGHAARSFLLGTLAVLLGPAWFAVVMVIWAPLVALGRVAMGVHYLSDIVAGMVVGIVMGFVCFWGMGFLM
jgi:undecaprenyl-diphosphatase